MHNQYKNITHENLRLCYCAMNYTDGLGVVHTIIQIYSYRYSVLFIEKQLSEEQKLYISELGLIKLKDNIYTTNQSYSNIAKFNEWATKKHLIFSNTAYCLLEEQISRVGRLYFEKRSTSNTQKEKTKITFSSRRKYTGSEDETAGLWYDFD